MQRLTHAIMPLLTFVLLAGAASSAFADNLFEGGDFEDGKRDMFRKNAPGNLVTGEVYVGDPVLHRASKKDEKDAKSRYCFKLTLRPPEKEGQRPQGYCTKDKGWPIDPTVTYRFRVRVYAPDAVTITIGGYSWDKDNKQLRTKQDRVWQYSIGVHGPKEGGWHTYEKTIGPEGSGADFVFLPQAAALNMAIWVNGHKNVDGGEAFFDDFVFEPIE